MRLLLTLLICGIFLSAPLVAQETAVLLPKRVEGYPVQFDDQDDIFGESYRWFLEGFVDRGTEKLRELLSKAGVTIDPNAYYVVVANFTNSFSPIGMFHGSNDFLNTRMYGLSENNLYYIFITRQGDTQSYVSALATAKPSPFDENLLPFLSLFIPIVPPVSVTTTEPPGPTTWIDVAQFTVPEAFQKYSDLSFIVKRDLSDEDILAQAIFDNTSKERWSFGVGTAITTLDDVDIIIGADGTIIVRPKDNLDLATFAMLNYHFSPIDTKAKRLQNSFHLLAGIRLVDFIEPVVGVGVSFDLGFTDLGIFAAYSVEFANELKEGFNVGDILSPDQDPFDMQFRGKPRFGLQIKFP